MYNVVNKGPALIFEGKGLTLEGSGEEKRLALSGRSIAFLNCPDLVVLDDLTLNNNLLKTLRNGPAKVGGVYNASDCLLEALEIQETKVGALVVAHNFGLKSLAGAPAVLKGLTANNCALASLDCGYARVLGAFDVSSNPLPTLRGGPQEIGWDYTATNCPLTEIGLRGLSITGMFSIWTWEPEVKQTLKHILDMPRCNGAQVNDDVPALGAVGRCANIDFGKVNVSPTTLFRTKLELVNMGWKNAAKLGDL